MRKRLPTLHPAVRFMLVGGVGCAVAFLITSQMVTGQGQPGRQPPQGQSATRATMTAAERAARFQPGPPWQGRGRTGLTQQQVQTFPDYPLFWLGEGFAGYNLQGIVRAKYDPPAAIPPQFAHGEDVIAFFYGTCTPDPGFNRCAVPAQVMIQPIAWSGQNTFSPL